MAEQSTTPNTPTDEPLTVELLPCPFCGSHAHVEQTGKPDSYSPAGYFAVSCVVCDATVDYPCNDQTEAAERWNTRTVPPAAQPATEFHACDDRYTDDGSCIICGAPPSASGPQTCVLCGHEDWRNSEGRCGALEQDGCNEGDVSRCLCKCEFPAATTSAMPPPLDHPWTPDGDDNCALCVFPFREHPAEPDVTSAIEAAKAAANETSET